MQNVSAFCFERISRGITRGAALLVVGLGVLAAPESKAQVNTLYAANIVSQMIETYDATTGALINSSFITGATRTTGMAVDPISNTLYLADFVQNTVKAYNATTGAPMPGFTTITGLTSPGDLTVSNGVLYVTNPGAGQVRTYNAATGALDNASFISATSLAPAVIGSTLYLILNNNSVSSYSPTTGAAISNPMTTGFNTPGGLAGVGTLLYVAQNGGNVIATVDTTTGLVINPAFASLPSVYGITYLNGVLYAAAAASGVSNKIVAFDATSGAALPGFTPVSSSAVYTRIVAVPEPSTLALLGLGVGFAGFLRRRCKVVVE